MSHSVVIGGAGFVGSWVVSEILKDPNAQVTIIDNLLSSEKWNISSDSRVTFLEGSASDIATLEKISGRVDFLYQLACFHGNQSSIIRPLDDLENGLKTTLVTLEWVRTKSPKTRVIYSGAGCAVAEKTWVTPEAVKEIDSTSLKHDSPYSISKITGEMYCLFYVNHYGLDVIRVRFQNVFGPREILGAGVWRGNPNTVWRNVIPTFIFKALNQVDLEIYGNNASRDFIYVEDIARGVVSAKNFGIAGDVYNLASGKETEIEKLAQLILDLTESQSKLLFKDRRSWDNSGRRMGDVSKAKNLLQFSAQVELKEGLENTVKWTKENLDKIELSVLKHSSQFSIC